MASTINQMSPEQDPGGRSMTVKVPNPRRSPGYGSSSGGDMNVLYDRRKRQKLSHSPEKESQHRQNPQQIADEIQKVLKSQESGSSDQSGSKWFSAANKNVDPAQRHESALDDDPPFYMSNHNNYIPKNFVASEDGRHFGGVSRMDSENEDLRGVIDDLTVENKKLKSFIRSQQRHSRGSSSEHSQQQQQDKLFEVRMHGLPPSKRRELEFLLKNFATSVYTSAPSKAHSASIGSTSASSTSQKITGKVPGNPRTDSGYGSNTTSTGVTNTTPPTHAPPAKPVASSNKAVRNYLQDIPSTLLPKRSPLMSERAKQALVVRRLEQLFTGRNADPGEHTHQIQQQEISNLAARADRAHDIRNNRKRKAEGTREAHIMRPDTKINLDTMDYTDGKDELEPGAKDTTSDVPIVSRPSSPDQRPTRPLDLDMHRAWAAAENFQYLRHLGLTSELVNDRTKLEFENTWLPLNLLTGLAQLHTLNVTPDTVRKAIRKLSKRLEVSKDGGRIRWAGGSDGTKFNPEDEKAIESVDVMQQEPVDDSGTGGSSNRSKTDSNSNGAIASTRSDEQNSGLQTSSDSKLQGATASGTSYLNVSLPTTKATTQSSAFDYKPIVYRPRVKSELEEFRDSDESMDTSSGDSSGLAYQLTKYDLYQKSAEEVGQLTFYNNPYFCSDFSSEQDPSNMYPPRHIDIGATLGVPVPNDMCESPLRHHDATYFTMQFAPRPFDPEQLNEQAKARFDASLPRFPALETIHEVGESEAVPIEMEVCGLGGVTPEDNFALEVKVEVKPAPRRGPDAIIRQLPFSRRKYLQKYASHVKSCHKIGLLPSKLPPPSYIFFTSSSSEGNVDDDSDIDDISESSDSSSSPFVDEEYPAPPAFLQQFSGSSADNLADDGDLESEIDMLALARKVNPQEIAEQERMYMMTQPGGAQRAVAGSLAATVGASRSGSSNHHAAGGAGGTSISDISLRSQGSVSNEPQHSDDDMDD